MANNINVGNAGEHLVAAHLLSQDFHVFVADRNNKAFDLAVSYNGKNNLLRVKTLNRGSAQWTCNKQGIIFKDLQNRNDYCVIVDITKGIAFPIFYVVPTIKVDETLLKCHDVWMNTKKRDGGTHKKSNKRDIWFSGTEDKIWRGYDKRWKKYKGNWDQLKGNALSEKRKALVNQSLAPTGHFQSI